MMKNVMNQGKIVITAAFLLSFTAACGGGEEKAQSEVEGMEVVSEVDEGMHQDGVDEAVVPPFLTDYMDVKNAMVNDNYEQAKEAALEMLSSLEGSEFAGELDAPVTALAEAEDIQAQRQAFAQLSEQLYQLVQNNQVSGQTLYWKHCPMAMDNAGAGWLSFEEQIQNPYMGQRMPKCGRVQETLNN